METLESGLKKITKYVDAQFYRIIINTPWSDSFHKNLDAIDKDAKFWRSREAKDVVALFFHPKWRKNKNFIFNPKEHRDGKLYIFVNVQNKLVDKKFKKNARRTEKCKLTIRYVGQP